MPSPNATPPRQFRLDDETLALLDKIAAHLAAYNHKGEPNRAAAIRFAAKEAAKKIPKNPRS